MTEAGSAKAIIHEAKTGTIFTLLDEVLHSVLFDWLIGNFEWRCRFCQWSNGEKAVADLQVIMDDIHKPLNLTSEAALEKYSEILEFFMENDGLIGWVDLPEEKQDIVFDAGWDGLIQSFGETESYQITKKGLSLYRVKD